MVARVLLLAALLVARTAHARPCESSARSEKQIEDSALDVFALLDRDVGVYRIVETPVSGKRGIVGYELEETLSGRPAQRGSTAQASAACGGATLDAMVILVLVRKYRTARPPARPGVHPDHLRSEVSAAIPIEYSDTIRQWLASDASARDALLEQWSRSTDPMIRGAAKKHLARR